MGDNDATCAELVSACTATAATDHWSFATAQELVTEAAPASIRVLRPVPGVDLAQVRTDYIAALDSRGFTSGSLGSTPVRNRERDDDLDGDIVRFEIDESANTLTVIADAFDTDSVVCLPFG